MKKLIVSMACLSVFGFAGTALAGNHKTDIAHCGCNADGSDLEWQFLSVSKNSKGHRQHEDYDEENCYVDDVLIGMYLRQYDDCILTPGQTLEGVDECVLVNITPVLGESCAVPN